MSKQFLKFIRLISVHRVPVLRTGLWSFFLFSCSGALLGQTDPVQKCSPSLERAVTLSPRQDGEAKLLLTLVVEDVVAFGQWAAAEGLLVRAVYRPANILVLEDGLRHLMEKILPRPDVLFADFGHEAGREELKVPGHNLFTNNIRFMQARQPQLDGSGVAISIKEYSFDTSDIDLRNRILTLAAASLAQTVHAGTMATLVAGAGNSDGAGRGVARGSEVFSSTFIGLLPDAANIYDQFAVRVQNHSYGFDNENYYGASALAYDKTTRDHPELLHVFSSGNSGARAAVSGTYSAVEGFANLTGEFKMAKNVLVVGAVDSLARVFGYSSRGPAYDGRVKPDLVAFGLGGTSESAALVSGAAAVVQQAFFEQYGYWPASDVTRAVLTGSAKDVDAPGPDFKSGYGNLDLKAAVGLVQNQLVESGSVGQGEEQVFTIELPANVRNVKATLVWNDPPALPNAPKALINDLDMELAGPNAGAWKPWVLSAFPHRDSLSLPARRGRDSLNTIEQISLDAPTPGIYQIRVRGYDIPNGPQSFAIAVRWDTLSFFEWITPVRTDALTAGKNAVLRWETDFLTETGTVEWRSPGSTDWNPINAAPGAEYLRWAVPDTFTTAQVRMRVAGLDFVSDTFLISPSFRLRVAFNCPDSVLLSWPALAQDVTYRLWTPGNRYLEPVFHTSDTAVVLKKSDYPELYFAVSAIAPGGSIAGGTSGAPNITQQGAGCYLNNLLALLNDEEAVALRLDLGSIYGVRKVFLEKQSQAGWTVLQESFPAGLQVFYTDASPRQGVNTYRARLDMDNGGVLIGDPVQVYYQGESGYLVYPNPIGVGRAFTVLSRVLEEVPDFWLFDVLGRQVLKQPLDDGKMDFSLPALSPGCYFWQVTDGGSTLLGKGKILVY